MEEWLVQIQALATESPWILFPIMLLGGLNIPVSEDGMLFVAGASSLRSLPIKCGRYFLRLT